MKFMQSIILVSLLILSTTPLMVAQEEEMSTEQWQQEMDKATARRNELKARFDQLTAAINDLQAQSATLDGSIAACEDELFAMMGMTRDQVDAFDRELADYENRTNELMQMSDADLLSYRDEITTMSKRVGEMSKSLLARLGRFAGRLSTLRSKIDSLISTLNKAGLVYTVGTWSRDRDCLWNIAKKPNIYSNAWLWPKIWQGNRDMISDPDIIQPGWKLNIPPGKEMTNEEKGAANSYYRKKARG